MDTNNIPSTKTLYADYAFSDSSFDNRSAQQLIQTPFGRSIAGNQSLSFNDTYSVPLDSVRDQVYGTEEVILNTLQGIEQTLLRKLFINPYIDPDLNEAHQRIWKEASYYMNIPDTVPATQSEQTTQLDEGADVIQNDEKVVISKDVAPNYICFDEYLFAEKFQSTASRRLITEYDEAVSQSTFSYFFQLRKLLSYLAVEIQYIKSSLLFDFGMDYENESQQKVALRYDTWAKMALHYTRRVASTILAKPGEIHHAEVDKVSKKQAAQFQAFFAIRLNAVDEEVNDLLQSLKRDLVDNGEVFYKRYITNAIKATKDIVESLELEYETTAFSRDFPTLSREVILASSVLHGNFGSVHADIIERYEMMISRVDAFFSLLHEKRRFAHNIAQLSEKAIQKKKILKTVVDDQYSTLFRSIPIDTNRNNTFKSSHAALDDLTEDHHPQYLMKDGGKVTGDISLAEGVKIGGVDIPNHAHDGTDGSARILSTSIDFDAARSANDIYESYVKKPLSLSIDRFIPDILDGGVPVFTTVLNIEVDDVDSGQEFEIIYIEVD